MVEPLFVLLIALIMDWYFGEPEILWSRFPHPIVLFGKAVSFADKRLNKKEDIEAKQYRKGALAISSLLLVALFAALLLEDAIEWIGRAGTVLEVIIVFTLLAQKSLADHVGAVATGLKENGLEGGRKAVSMIVGRDPSKLDKSGVSRASIESLAENFSDGVVAPAFWYAVFGLPGIIVYKMINTADSMIAYRNEKYLWFGRVAAQIDDLANWVPARISAVLIAIGAGLLYGVRAFKNALIVTLKDSGLHRSPNAGWPEAAMAGGADISLGGPRVYPDEIVKQAYLNSAGKSDLGIKDIEQTIKIFALACFTFWFFIGVLAVLF